MKQHSTTENYAPDPRQDSEAFLASSAPLWVLILATISLGICLYSLSLKNFAFYHSLLQTFFIVISFTIFSIGWNTRKFTRHNALLVLAVSYVVIGSFGILYFTSTPAMNIFPDISYNTSSQLWLAGRYLEAIAFIASAAVLHRQNVLIPPWPLLGLVTAFGLLTLLTIWPYNIFPNCYIEGHGITPFMIVSNLIIAMLFGLSILLFWRQRDSLGLSVLKRLTAALVFSILAEMVAALYPEAGGLSNFISHFFKFISVVLLYRALIFSTLRFPYATLFHNLHQAKKRLDLELVQKRKIEQNLRIANRELDAFARTISHDLRTPLTPIIGLPELLIEQKKDELDENTKKSLRDIREQGLRITRFLEDMLSFARAGRLVEGVAPEKLPTTVQQVLEDLGSRLAFAEIEVKRHDLPDVSLPGTAMFQIFSNLINNAIKYAGKEGSPIEIGGKLDGQYVEIFVSDHGPGIPVDKRKRIFDVFYRGDNYDDTAGSGVGLATVLKIAKHLEGDAWVEETKGGGSTFKVKLHLPEAERQQKLDFSAAATD